LVGDPLPRQSRHFRTLGGGSARPGRANQRICLRGAEYSYGLCEKHRNRKVGRCWERDGIQDIVAKIDGRVYCDQVLDEADFVSGTQTTSGVRELFGDPGTLAPYQFRLAQDLCAECRDYHAIWPYRRLSRTVSGIEATADIVEALLREATQPNGRILIAGAGDAGMLALTVQATKNLTPFIDVADRCQTPLAVCRRYAETHGLTITTLHLDFGSSTLAQRYDVVFGDCILQFVPRQFHVEVLRRLAQAMTKRSTLVLVERLRASAGSESRRGDRAAETLSGLAAQGIELPEDEPAFLLRLNRMLNAQRTRIADYSVPCDLSSCLAEAGFHLRDLSDPDRQRTAPLPDGESVTMKIAVASPVRD